MKKLRKLILSLTLCLSVILSNVCVTEVKAADGDVTGTYMTGRIVQNLLYVDTVEDTIDDSKNCLDGVDLTGVEIIDLTALNNIPDYAFQNVTGVTFRGLSYVNNIGVRAFADSSFNISKFMLSLKSVTMMTLFL